MALYSTLAGKFLLTLGGNTKLCALTRRDLEEEGLSVSRCRRTRTHTHIVHIKTCMKIHVMYVSIARVKSHRINPFSPVNFNSIFDLAEKKEG